MTENPYQAPNTPPPVLGPGAHPFAPPETGDGTGGLIPYKNPKALTAYYLGILSLLCCFAGLPLGIVPLVLGIQGLRDRSRNPVIKGSVHAWIGIVCGAIATVGSILFLGVLISVFLSANR